MNESEQRVIDSLNNLGVDFKVLNIDPEFSDTVVFCEKYSYPPEHTCNTIVVVSKKGERKYAACVITANTRLDVNKRVKALLAVSKCSFATAEEMMELTGMQVGGVTPLSLPADMLLFVDDRVMQQPWVILGGGGRAIKIKISPDIFNKLNAQIINDLAIS